METLYERNLYGSNWCMGGYRELGRRTWRLCNNGIDMDHDDAKLVPVINDTLGDSAYIS
jgi:hypothetical protein